MTFLSTLNIINLNPDTYRQSLARGLLRMYERTVGHKGHRPVTPGGYEYP